MIYYVCGIFLAAKSKKMAVEALVELFYQQENLARTEEKKTDAILDGDENEKQEREKAKEKSKEENMEETIAMCKLQNYVLPV